MIIFNKVEMPFVAGTVEQIIESAIMDQRFSHLAGKNLTVIQNGRPIVRKERASTMVSDGDVISVMEIYFGG